MSDDLIQDHLDWLRGCRKSPLTVRDRGLTLRRADRQLPYGLERAIYTELSAWLGNERWSPKTARTYWEHLHYFYEWACDPRLPDGLDENPMAMLSAPENPRFLPRPVAATNLAAMLRGDRPYRTYVMLAALAGARCIEISRLDREDVTEQTILLKGKGNREKILDTHPDLWAELEPLPPGPIARMHDGSRASAGTVSTRSAWYFRHGLGLKLPPHAGLHSVRHWYATTMLEGGADLRTVQEAMGHASVSSTQIYTLVTDPRRRAAINSLQLPA